MLHSVPGRLWRAASSSIALPPRARPIRRRKGLKRQPQPYLREIVSKPTAREWVAEVLESARQDGVRMVAEEVAALEVAWYKDAEEYGSLVDMVSPEALELFRDKMRFDFVDDRDKGLVWRPYHVATHSLDAFEVPHDEGAKVTVLGANPRRVAGGDDEEMERQKNELNPVHAMVALVSSVKTSLDLAMYSISPRHLQLDDHLRELHEKLMRKVGAAAAKENPPLRVVVDADQFNFRWCKPFMRDLALDGVPVKVLSGADGALMHQKLLIADGTTVITGSSNYSRNAMNSNWEGGVRIESVEVAAQFQRQFDQMWKHGKDVLAKYPK